MPNHNAYLTSEDPWEDRLRGITRRSA